MVSIQHGIMGALFYVETYPAHMFRDVSLGSIGVGLVFHSERLNCWANIGIIFLMQLLIRLWILKQFVTLAIEKISIRLLPSLLCWPNRCLRKG